MMTLMISQADADWWAREANNFRRQSPEAARAMAQRLNATNARTQAGHGQMRHQRERRDDLAIEPRQVEARVNALETATPVETTADSWRRACRAVSRRGRSW